jgi:hypothetical protein
MGTLIVKYYRFASFVRRISIFCISFIGLVVSSIQSSYALTSYEIEVAYNDELFIVNREKFKAKTFCLGWQEGEQVVFVEGSDSGFCTSAVLFNLDRKEKCEVWCE